MDKEYHKAYDKQRYANLEYREKRKLYEKEKGARNRKAYLEWKATLSCIICFEKESCCLEFHHLDPTKKDFEISTQASKNLEYLKREAEKCAVLCSNCHKKVHAGLVYLVKP